MPVVRYLFRPGWRTRQAQSARVFPFKRPGRFKGGPASGMEGRGLSVLQIGPQKPVGCARLMQKLIARSKAQDLQRTMPEFMRSAQVPSGLAEPGFGRPGQSKQNSALDGQGSPKVAYCQAPVLKMCSRLGRPRNDFKQLICEGPALVAVLFRLNAPNSPRAAGSPLPHAS